jgi:hypothetical protein
LVRVWVQWAPAARTPDTGLPAQPPGLDEVGRAQAEAIAKELGPLGPLPLATSPLRRARETAVPLEALWGVKARVEPGVAEIPSPTEDLQARATWLRQVMRGRWSDMAVAQQFPLMPL